MNTFTLPQRWTLHAFDCLGSTNEEAARHAEAGAGEGTVIVARQQVSGRGRRGRHWQSPPGNAYSSVIVRPQCPAQQAAQLGFVVGLAVAETVRSLIGAEHAVRVKWPNDVLVDGAKIAGILLESSAGAGGNVAYVVIGTGINVAYHPPVGETPYRTTSLHALGAQVAPGRVLEAYLEALARGLALWRSQGFAAVRRNWLALAANLGEPIDVKLGKEQVRGVFSRLDETGALILDLPEGGERRISAGEIFPVAA